MTTRYKILFMTELLHEYYSNLQCNDFSVSPSEETRAMMAGRRMLFKVVGNKLVVLVRVNDEGADEDKPVTGILPTDKFIFYLQPERPRFQVVTNIDADKLREGKRYYFTNRNENKLDDNLNLTKKIEAVAGAANYIPGDLIADAGSIVYECIRSTNESNNPPSAFWHERGKQQYVSGADMIRVRTRVDTYKLTIAASQFSISVMGFNTASNDYDKPIKISNDFITTNEPTDIVQANLSELLPGIYRIRINNETFEAFIDDAVVYQSVFGIIEIFCHLPAGNDFALVKTNGKVKDEKVGGNLQWLKFCVRFANRLAYWKYNTPKHGVSSINDGGAIGFDAFPAIPGNKDYFISKQPIPLLEQPWHFKVNVLSLANDEDPLAPNPDPELSAMLSRSVAEKDYYCTINLNY